MKKSLLVTALFLITAGIYAVGKKDRKDDINKVSYTAIQQFEQEFTSAKNVSWKVDDKYIKANFTANGKRLAALYDLKGNYTCAVERLTYDQLPAKARFEIDRRFKDYNTLSVLKIVNKAENSSKLNEIGAYWVDLGNEEKHLLVNVSPSSTVLLHKTIANESIAKN